MVGMGTYRNPIEGSNLEKRKLVKIRTTLEVELTGVADELLLGNLFLKVYSLHILFFMKADSYVVVGKVDKA